ncbi:MAG: alanine--tRNA ligase [Oscillospiraceae bacterium]|nr:alanine--tRNA ligase [Oscillospiraceae bacterium]
MQWTGVNDLREKYLSFFEGKNHTRLESAPLVPKDDPSLLLINSGMAPLKNYFTGLEVMPGNRAASCQKCIRTPDIENVGKTARHGTFFEMLGNFSFGDYFKEDATKWAWEFLTQTLEIPAQKLYPTVYVEDDEAFDIWVKNRGIAPERVIKLGKEDNFWEHGSGPCGPSSEILYDRGEKYGCGKEGCAPGCDCDRYVEIWNLVFTQFNSDGKGTYTPLPKPNIDTGLGLERLACVMQDADNIFEIDTIQDIINYVAKLSGVTYKQDEKTDISLRVIADHIRSTVFMAGDGIVPQNEGRGYVLRRLLRRAARHGMLLGIKGDFLYKVCDTVIALNREAYPALSEDADYIRKVIRAEEARFSKTVEQGMELLMQVMDALSQSEGEGEKTIPGEDVFRLYDTFGFPVDLTVEIARDRGMKVDEEGFLHFMHKQRETARKAREEQNVASWEEDLLAGISFTGKFTGYDTLTANTKVVALVKDGALADEICEGDNAIVFVEETPFYAESGGQVGDTGVISAGKNIFKVTDCRKSPAGHTMHIGRMVSGFIPVGDPASAAVDGRRRSSIMRNHTAAHLLQSALRQTLGSHVRQAGSYVSDSVCRFDFTHFSACTPEQLAETQRIVNSMIMAALPVHAAEMPIDEAKKLGAVALFGDKYGDIVRVVTAGDKSAELCGGTHTANTSMLGLFKITGESSVAAGVRRIEAVTGCGVLELLERHEDILAKLGAALKATGPLELESRIAAMQSQVRGLQKELDSLNQKRMEENLGALDGSIEQLGGLRFIAADLGDVGADALRSAADRMKDKYADIVGVFTAVSGGKGSILVFAGKDAVKAGIHAGKLVKEIAALTGGGGGGRPDSAMGGMGDPTKAKAALSAAKGLIENRK